MFADFLRKVWRDQITFHELNLPNLGRVSDRPNAVITDDIGIQVRRLRPAHQPLPLPSDSSGSIGVGHGPPVIVSG